MNDSIRSLALEALKKLGVNPDAIQGDALASYSPIDGSLLLALKADTEHTIEAKIAAAEQAFYEWREIPAPRRGELVRIFGQLLRAHKEELATLVTIECGKIIEEGRGEVQEMIDICDFAVGLSRQLYGLTIASERKAHVMQENWLPLGPVGIISAFNFPVAVWAWNAALALICGDSVLWKPSEKTPLCAIATAALLERAIMLFNDSTGITAPKGLSSVIIGFAESGEQLVEDARIPLISATGSSRMGRIIGPKVAARFGRSLLELGGNNAVIVSKYADIAIALPSILFGAVGTAGQRCTTTRRLIVHESRIDQLFSQLTKLYASITENKIGNPLEKTTLIGPLIDEAAFLHMQDALDKAKGEALALQGGGRMLPEHYPDGYYAAPALVRMAAQTEIMRTETFAPILYVMPYQTLEEAVALNNAVPQGLSAAIFTTDMREAEYFKQHSDTGISNVNIGTSGAEIGGAFGGEKETGGGRESGSDSWKNYMRRQTSTSYYGTERPGLAQGIEFAI